MKAILQRVSQASVTIDSIEHAKIEQGFLILLGVMGGDCREQVDSLVNKIVPLRVFTDEADKMNLSLAQVDGSILVISNFTLGANCKKGRRPSFEYAATPEIANELYQYFIEQLSKHDLKSVQSGVFGADMKVSLVNDGPVTIILDTNELK